MRNTLYCFAIAALLFFMGLFLFLTPVVMFIIQDAEAHENWINDGDYRGRYGEHCCDEKDIEQLASNRVEHVQGGYMVDRRVFIPATDAKPSEDGKWWVAWKVRNADARCFFYPGNDS